MAALGRTATRSFNTFTVLFLLAQVSIGIADRYRTPTLSSLGMNKIFPATISPNVNGLAPTFFIL